jgi:NitT/TauT family transport system substrate-binding protein
VRPLKVCGYDNVIEIAPALLVAKDNPGLAEVVEGGLASLFPAEDRLTLTGGRTERDRHDADLACQAETVTLRVSVQKPDLRLIMVLTEGDYRIIARRSGGIVSLQDLRGKRMATLRGTSSDYFLHLMLQSVGLSQADMAFVPGLRGAQGVAEAIIKGEADAVTIWEPEIERVADALGDDVVSFSNPGLYRERYGIHATAGSLADPIKRRQIVQFLAKIFDTSKTCKEDPGKVIPSSAARSGFGEDLLRRAWPHLRFPADLSPDLLDVMVAEEVWLAQFQNRQPRPRSEISRLVDSSVLKEAREFSLANTYSRG